MDARATTIEQPPTRIGIKAASGSKNNSPTIKMETAIPGNSVISRAGINVIWKSLDKTEPPVTYTSPKFCNPESCTADFTWAIELASGIDEKLRTISIVSLFEFTKFLVNDLRGIYG